MNERTDYYSDTKSENIVISLPLNILVEAGHYAVNLPDANEGTASPEIFSAAAVGRNERLPCTLKGARDRRPRLQLILPDA